MKHLNLHDVSLHMAKQVHRYERVLFVVAAGIIGIAMTHGIPGDMILHGSFVVTELICAWEREA